MADRKPVLLPVHALNFAGSAMGLFEDQNQKKKTNSAASFFGTLYLLIF